MRKREIDKIKEAIALRFDQIAHIENDLKVLQTNDKDNVKSKADKIREINTHKISGVKLELWQITQRLKTLK